MAQNYSWPTSSSVTLTGTPNNAPIPSTSILVAGENSLGNQQVFQMDASGALMVAIEGQPGTPLNENLVQVGGSSITLGQKASAASLPVVIASDQSAVPASQSGIWNINNVTGTVSLPTGASTSANQTNGAQKTQIVDGSGNVIASTSNALDVAITQPIPTGANSIGTVGLNTGTNSIGTVGLNAGVNTIGSIANISGTIVLPTGAATSANQTNGTQKTQVVDGSGNVQPSGDVAARALFEKITDGTNTMAVKAASTAAAATDPAAVVSLSPNSPVPAGTNSIGTVGLNTGSNTIGSIANISGTVSLPTGAATSALQTQISGQLPTALGQKTSANSLAVVVASDQSKIPVTAATPTAGTITQTALTVGTTAVRLTVSGSAPSATRSVLVVTPDSTSTASFYIGSSSVTNSGSTRGIQITAGQTFTANSDAADYYIVSSTASQTVYVMEQA